MRCFIINCILLNEGGQLDVGAKFFTEYACTHKMCKQGS